MKEQIMNKNVNKGMEDWHNQMKWVLNKVFSVRI